VRKVPRGEGWVKVRQAGSHETRESADAPRVVTVAGKDSDTVPVGTLAAIRRATGIGELR
jgi:predicted RNA binding protein YcfA (HicA-like mRNA interferase family)